MQLIYQKKNYLSRKGCFLKKEAKKKLILEELAIEAEKNKRKGKFWLILSFIGMVVFCSSVAIIFGTKIWIDNYLWVNVISWVIIILILVFSIKLWANKKKYFKFSKVWLFYTLVITAFGVWGGYQFTSTVSDINTIFKINEIKEKHGSLIKATSMFDGRQWDSDKCQKYGHQMEVMRSDIMGRDFAPTRYEFNIIMAVNQIMFISGCDVEFEGLAESLLDKNNKWKNTSPWRYFVLRAWANEVGWPRDFTGCLWEAQRAEVLGNKALSEQIKQLCVPKEKDRITPWTYQNAKIAQEILDAQEKMAEENNKNLK